MDDALTDCVDRFSLYNLGKYKESEEAYAKALQLDPGNASVKTALAQARSKLPKDEDAAVASGNSSGAGGLPSGFDPAALSSMFGNNPGMANMYFLFTTIAQIPDY